MIEHNKIYKLVLNIIKDEATKEKPLNQSDIISKLREDPENECDRRTVSRALQKLISDYGVDEDGDWPDESMMLHYSVRERSSSPVYHSFWFEINNEEDDHGFSDEELMFLMDAVQFSKHIDQKYAEEIIGKLAKLSNNSYSGIFEPFTSVNEKNVPVKKDFFLIIGDINMAIQQQKMITFFENKYGVDKKPHHVSDEPVKVCPYNIVVSDGYYYLLCGEKYSNAIKSYRLDMISDVHIVEETFSHSLARKAAALHPNDYLAEHRYMNAGETVNVTLMIDRSILGDVIDSFGTKIKIDPADESSNRLTIHIKSSEKDIIDWAMRYGEYAEILDPDYLRSEIIERANLIAGSYRAGDSYINYCEQVSRAERSHRLYLANINLDGQESYKHLNGIERVTLRHNGINDFSFLASYTDLWELTITHNEIKTPEVLAQLSHLKLLGLGMTGIKNLDFLAGLENLRRLTLYEFSLENVEAIYTLPHLRYLTVNKPVSRLIDTKRLKRVFGNRLVYNIENNSGITPLSFRESKLPPAEGRLRIAEREGVPVETFTTCRISSTSKASLWPMINSGLRIYRRSNKVFNLLDGACGEEERKRLFEDLGHYAGNEYVWYVTYEGDPVEDGTDPDAGRVWVISIFKHDHGLKLVATAKRNRFMERSEDTSYEEIYNKEMASWSAHVRYLMDSVTCWAELSDNLERAFLWECTMQDVIDPAALKEYKVFRDIEIEADDYHYYRPDDSGKRNVKKICYGHIEI